MKKIMEMSLWLVDMPAERVAMAAYVCDGDYEEKDLTVGFV